MSARRPARRALRWCAPLLAVLLAVVMLPAGASAARLPLTGASRSFSVEAATRCDDADTVTPTGTGSTTSVTLGNLAPACAGMPLRVQVWDTTASSSTPAAFTATGTVPATATTLVLTGTAFTPSAAQRALVTLAAWPIPTTWVPPAPAVACTVTGVVRVVGSTRVVDPPTGQTCSATIVGVTTPGSGGSYSDLWVRLTTTSTSTLQWSLAVNFADPAIAFSPRGVSVSPNATVTSVCSALPVVRVAADAPLTDTLTLSNPRDLWVRGHQSATGSSDLACP